MSLRNKILLVCLGFGFLIPLVIGFFNHKTDLAWEQKVAACYESEVEASPRVDCWFTIIKDRYLNEGTVAAFTTFEYIYGKYDIFANTGCHRHAHRVGDYAYYYDYLTHQDITKTEFPKNAVACGYGFYHGFFEHLIQDNPDPAFVTETCEYMRENMYEVAPAISQTCYHGSGHGFTLAQADVLTDSSMWNLSNFVDKPLEQCESLPNANEGEVKECRQGVFNVVVDWMADEEFGFAYNYEYPFLVCDSQTYDRQPDCYYEMAQKLDSLSNQNPVKAVEFVKQISRSEFWPQIFGVAVAGMVQHNPKGSQTSLVGLCRQLDTIFMEACFRSVVGGQFEHNTSAGDYSNVFAFCASDELTQTEQGYCYDSLSMSLKRFYTEAEINNSCLINLYPAELCELFAG